MSNARFLASLRDLVPTTVSAYSPAGLMFALLVFIVLRLSRPSKLDAIPTVGSGGWLGSWWDGVKYLTNALDPIQEGYEKYHGAPFKVAVLHRWMIIISRPEHVEELRTAPDDTLSFLDGINNELQIEHTMGHGIHYNPYHIPILRSQLTRSIAALYPEIRSEIITAFDDVLDLKANEWKSVLAFRSVQQVVCRTSNRLFVGLPLCHDPDWIDLNIQYSLQVVKGAFIIRLFPSFLKPLAARFFTKVTESNERGRRLLGPMIEERQRHQIEYGNEWVDKPNDLLSWLMDEAVGPESTVESLTTRVLATNFVAIHTTSVSFTNALFYLAAYPQYVQPLREEVEAVVREEGWSKAALGKMYKVDSFLKESERMEGFSALSLIRKALKDFTFSDGSIVPKGTIVAAAMRAVHFDQALYPKAHVFEPFRFSDLRQEAGEGLRHQFASTTTEYLAFGHGRHACPGRFFAASELKSMLAHAVVTYDVKLEGATRPQTVFIGTSMTPDPNARIMIRRRVNHGAT